MSGGTLNLSLLSRGVGEVHTNGHEKVDVYLEPEDYLNFSTQGDKLYQPSLQPKYPPSINDSQMTSSTKAVQKFRVPKTYSTRKGALLLFSEDLALKYTDMEQLGAHHSPSGLHSQISLKTVEDLANSILTYGGQGHVNDRIYLKFVHAHRGSLERQFRPGFSAKRYLSTWTRTWDDAVFDSVIKHGYITEKSLHQYSLSLPGLRRRLVYDDLSRIPEPYKLMRNMLMSPGSLSGYTFYSTPTQDVENEKGESRVREVELAQSDKIQNIHVIQTKDTVQREVMYADLDRQSQQEVITDLLVKSAVHYALKKQEEVYTDTVIRALKSQRRRGSGEDSGDDSVASSIHKFDMKEAVESLLESQHDRLLFGGKLPDVDDFSHNADRNGSFKGRLVSSRTTNHQAHHDGHWHDYESGSEHWTDRRDSTESATSLSNVPILPPIHSRLSPIKDVSRDASQQSFSLPPLLQGTSWRELPQFNIQDATPRDSESSADTGTAPGAEANKTVATRSLTSPDIDALSDQEDNDAEGGRSFQKSQDMAGTTSTSSHKDFDRAADGAVGNSIGQSESVTMENRLQSRRKSDAWVKAGEGNPVSMKGSRIMAPDGEIINVGGAIFRGNGQGLDVGAINDGRRQQESSGMNIVKASISDVKTIVNGVKAENHEEKKKSNILPRIKQNKSTHRAVSDSRPEVGDVTEHAIVDMLTSHARLVAENVLSQPSAGTDLETDVKDVIDEVMRSRSTSSESSSADEYKSRIRKSLTIAVTKVAGLDPNSVSDDAEISLELLDALVNQQMAPDQIEVVTDVHGHTRIQPKVDVLTVVRGLHEEIHNTDSQHDTETINRDEMAVLYELELPTEYASGEPDTEQADSLPGETKETSLAEPDSLPTKEKTHKEQKLTSSVVKKGKKATPGSSMNVTRGKRGDNTKPKRFQGVPPKSQTSNHAMSKEMSVEAKEEPFVVGMPKEKTSSKTAEPADTHKEIKKVKKGKKGATGKKKTVKQSQQQTAVTKQPVEKPAFKTQSEEKAAVDKPQEMKDVERDLSPPQLACDVSESRMSSPEVKSDDSESDYNFVREQSSPEPEDRGEGLSQSRHQVPSPGMDEDDRLDVEDGDDDETSKLKSISNREARAARRAAAAAKRREEVERRRKLKEEQLKREKEESERQIALQKEMEEQRKKGEEERRLRLQQKLDEAERERMESEETDRRRTLEVERERRAKEEYLRKLQEMKRKQHEEDQRKRELMLQQQKEEEERKAAEELMLSKMALQERLEYERMKKEKEEERQRKELEEKLQRAEEAKTAMEEAQRLAEEMARKQAELEARLRFNRSIQDETSRLTQAHSINRAFVFSYFELLQWLGLDIPEFELAKLAEY